MTIRELAKATKELRNNENMRLQVTKAGRSYRTYRCYGNDWFQDNADEKTLGFITYPMTVAQVREWLSDEMQRA